MKHLIPAFLIFVLCCCSPIEVLRTEPLGEITRTAANDAWRKTVSSTVQIYQLDSAGNKDGYGAGVCIASGQSELGNVYVFLTVKHVLHDRYFPIVSLMDIFIGPEEDPEPIQHCLVVFTYDDRGQSEPEKKEIKEQDAFFVKVLYKSDDLGLLFVMTHEELDINPVDLVSEEEARCLEIGDNVYMTGCPGGPRVSFKKGMISAITDSRLHIDGGIYFGSSGGGVFNTECKLIAVTSAMTSETNSIVIPVSKVYDFFRENNIAFPRMEREE